MLIFFILLGHGSLFGKSWGSPAFIDEVYLRNPMEPPDVLGMAQDPGPAPKLPDRKKSKLLLICVTFCDCRIQGSEEAGAECLLQ